jgi:hypothetical protein
MVAITYRMDVGFAGTTNRQHDSTVVAENIDPANPPRAYGIGVVIDPATGGVRPPLPTDPNMGSTPPGMAYGLYVRPWITQGGGLHTPVNDPLGVSTPPDSGHCNVMRRGFMTVQLHGAAPAVKGARAFVWTAAAGGGQVPGGVTADGTVPGSVMMLPGIFMGAADAKGIVEVQLNL